MERQRLVLRVDGLANVVVPKPCPVDDDEAVGIVEKLLSTMGNVDFDQAYINRAWMALDGDRIVCVCEVYVDAYIDVDESRQIPADTLLKLRAIFTEMKIDMSIEKEEKGEEKKE